MSAEKELESVSNEAAREIEKIMSEINSLQQNLASTVKGSIQGIAEGAADTLTTANKEVEMIRELDLQDPAPVQPAAPVVTAVAPQVVAQAPVAAINLNTSAPAKSEAQSAHLSLVSNDVSVDLGDIISEVNAVNNATPEVVAQETEMKEFYGSSADASMEETLIDTPVENGEGEFNMANENNGHEDSLTMALSGSMTLKLKYQFSGQEITIGFKDSFLTVVLADGTEFKIPVGQKSKKAA